MLSIIFLIVWLGASIGSGLYILIGSTMYIREMLDAKRENREIGPRYKGMLRNIGVLLLVGLILIGLFFGLSYLAMRGM